MLLDIVTGMLLASSPSPATNQPATEKQEERKICRREVETGSLIKGKKVCMTAKQWEKIADANRDELERTSSMGSKSGQ